MDQNQILVASENSETTTMVQEEKIMPLEYNEEEMFKTMVYCPNTGNYIGASHQACKQKNVIIGPSQEQQPSDTDDDKFKKTDVCMYCHSQLN